MPSSKNFENVVVIFDIFATIWLPQLFNNLRKNYRSLRLATKDFFEQRSKQGYSFHQQIFAFEPKPLCQVLPTTLFSQSSA